MVSLRTAGADDRHFLERMLVEAANWDSGRPRLSHADVLARPHLEHYVIDWLRPGDAGVVARSETGDVIGAAWYRQFTAEDPGYGYVAESIPELSIGVEKEWRGHGVGEQLLLALAEHARQEGIEALSLSVERNNPAVRLYRRVGFRILAEDDTALTMILRVVR